ncbi:hypothetical protein L226DRAFT_333071 [Lentinus tigrinus ALCF2SS1-7]|uniref:Uncharacterized protein n=1 Tax=Lentinus tigrinus ALCF2SS1-6 TaxID=1328759 RepID=A0A5C2SFG4_9APHY|nr:hypothetical protein L227DRAFT_35121 [Lentinus tigrinus ALCF2SS1-6]RPD77822.1 hypothetical protein L226DRAFT_333071 [Lentinus tigrinus ALCF2SS1-7]
MVLWPHRMSRPIFSSHHRTPHIHRNSRIDGSPYLCLSTVPSARLMQHAGLRYTNRTWRTLLQSQRSSHTSSSQRNMVKTNPGRLLTASGCVFGLLTEHFVLPLASSAEELVQKVNERPYPSRPNLSLFPSRSLALPSICVVIQTCELLQNVAATFRDQQVQVSLCSRHWPSPFGHQADIWRCSGG